MGRRGPGQLRVKGGRGRDEIGAAPWGLRRLPSVGGRPTPGFGVLDAASREPEVRVEPWGARRGLLGPRYQGQGRAGGQQQHFPASRGHTRPPHAEESLAFLLTALCGGGSGPGCRAPACQGPKTAEMADGRGDVVFKIPTEEIHTQRRPLPPSL